MIPDIMQKFRLEYVIIECILWTGKLSCQLHNIYDHYNFNVVQAERKIKRKKKILFYKYEVNSTKKK